MPREGSLHAVFLGVAADGVMSVGELSACRRVQQSVDLRTAAVAPWCFDCPSQCGWLVCTQMQLRPSRRSNASDFHVWIRRLIWRDALRLCASVVGARLCVSLSDAWVLSCTVS
jgi:hypothetical protein